MEFLEMLKTICQKEPSDLTIMEVGFLKARKSYLTGEQLQKFESILGEIKSKSPEKVLKNKKL